MVLHDQLASLGTIWAIQSGVDAGWRLQFQAGRGAAEGRHSIVEYSQPVTEWRLPVASRHAKPQVLASR